MGAILGVVGLGLVIRPLKPFLVAEHPVLLEFGAAAICSRSGQARRSLASARLHSGWSLSPGPSGW